MGTEHHDNLSKLPVLGEEVKTSSIPPPGREPGREEVKTSEGMGTVVCSINPFQSKTNKKVNV